MTELLPSDRELQALKVLWNQGEASVQEVCDAVNREGNDLAYTTILSLLQVMEQKGLVGHRRVSKAYAYFPKVQRERTLRTLAARFLEKVFDGALDEYLVHALQSRPLSVEALERLEKMLAEAKDRSQGKRKKGD